MCDDILSQIRLHHKAGRGPAKHNQRIGGSFGRVVEEVGI